MSWITRVEVDLASQRCRTAHTSQKECVGYVDYVRERANHWALWLQVERGMAAYLF